jgi:hypothetical protein
MIAVIIAKVGESGGKWIMFFCVEDQKKVKKKTVHHVNFIKNLEIFKFINNIKNCINMLKYQNVVLQCFNIILFKKC